MAGQRTRIKREKAAAVKVEALVDGLVAEAKERAKRNSYSEASDFPGITAEDVLRERDEKGLGWAQAAANLSLPNGRAARKAYTILTGKDWRESNPAITRSSRGGWRGRKAVLAPLWDDDADQGEIEDAMNGRTIVVHHSYKGLEWVEEIEVGKVSAFTFGPEGDQELQVEFYGPGLEVDRFWASGPFRCVAVANIKEVK